MARIRTIKPEFWTDERVVELTPFARLLFIGLWNFCDDEGRMVYSPKRIKLQIFPSDTLDISELFGELRGNSADFGKPLVEVYESENIQYLQVSNFNKHQKVDKRTASRFPPPPISAEFPRGLPPYQGRYQGMEMDQGGDQGMDLSTKEEIPTKTLRVVNGADPGAVF